MLRPTKPSSAGSSVTDASIVVSTPIEMPMATPRMIDVFMSSRPSTEITTVVPAKSTARPAVSTRVHDAAFGIEPGREVLAVSRDDEQRVVDADAEADHRHRRGGEVGHVDDGAHAQHDRDTGADAEQRGADRQAHREHRAEREQQDDHRRERCPIASLAPPISALANMSPPNSMREPGHVDRPRRAP